MTFDMAKALGQHPSYKAKKKRKKPIQHERDKVHIPFANYLRLALDKDSQLFWHTPNEGKIPMGYRIILKAMGLLPGVPDIVVLTAPVGMVAMEAKYGKGKLSADQEKFKAVWERFFPYVTFRTPEEGEAALRDLNVPLKASYQKRAGDYA